ncbi:MAG: 3-deoxy-manno-octulosonate cytidylyltransferase [Sphingobium sp.]|nr:3-deoxy-manno-octulosonate cytidylyltransferase [Sphingobium sp.]
MLRIVSDTTCPARAQEYAVIIPARFGSSRFPGKPLVALRGASGQAKSLIERSWEAACRGALAENVWIATDDNRIEEAARNFGAQVVQTSPACRNGTERCWDAVKRAGITAQVIVNLQGDSPLTPPVAVEMLIDTMLRAPGMNVATPMVRCSTAMVDRLIADDRAGRVGGTTVVCDIDMNALYFSKRVIPYTPDRFAQPPIYLHMGLYGYRRDALEVYASLAPSKLELVEGLEQLRFLQTGIPIRMLEVSNPPGGLWEINHPTDIVTVEAALAERSIH